VAKERTRSGVEQAANTLRNSQDDYSRIYWDNREQAKLPGDLPQSNIDQEAAAERAVATNEESLHQKQFAYEQAQADEITGLQSAESQLREADQKLRTTREGATQAKIVQAQASVDQARASLAKLRQGGTAADIALDALRGTDLTGTVSYIAPSAETDSGVVTYNVRVNLDALGEAVRVGMTANLDIVYAQKDGALLVPTAALLPKGAGYAVQVPGADGQP